MRVHLNFCKESPHQVNIGCTFVLVVFQFLTRFLHIIYIMKTRMHSSRMSTTRT